MSKHRLISYISLLCATLSQYGFAGDYHLSFKINNLASAPIQIFNLHDRGYLPTIKSTKPKLPHIVLGNTSKQLTIYFDAVALFSLEIFDYSGGKQGALLCTLNGYSNLENLSPKNPLELSSDNEVCSIDKTGITIDPGSIDGRL